MGTTNEVLCLLQVASREAGAAVITEVTSWEDMELEDTMSSLYVPTMIKAQLVTAERY